MLHIFKKKEKTPEQKIRTSKITLIIVICLGVAAIVMSKIKTKESEEQSAPTENVMDTQLDTLLVHAGFANYEIQKTCDLESYIEEPYCADEDSLSIINFKIKFAETMGESGNVTDELYELANILSQKVEEFKENNKGVEMKARRIYFTSEGTNYTCFQTLSPEGEQKLIYLTIIDNKERPRRPDSLSVTN